MQLVRFKGELLVLGKNTAMRILLEKTPAMKPPRKLYSAEEEIQTLEEMYREAK